MEFKDLNTDEKRQKVIPLGYSIIGICGTLSSNWKERLVVKDLLIWKPPGGFKVKLKDLNINPVKPKGIKSEELS